MGKPVPKRKVCTLQKFRHRESLMLGFRYETVKITMLLNQMFGDEFCTINSVELFDTFRTFNIAGITIIIFIKPII